METFTPSFSIIRKWQGRVVPLPYPSATKLLSIIGIKEKETRSGGFTAESSPTHTNLLFIQLREQIKAEL
jgi:hypothetical protein